MCDCLLCVCARVCCVNELIILRHKCPIALNNIDNIFCSPPAHKRVQGMDHSISTRGIRHSVSPQKTVEADKAIHRSDRLVLIEDRGIAVMEYRAEGFWVHQVGLIDVPKDLRDMWKTKGTLEKVRDGLRLLEMQHRDPSGVEVWSIADQQGRVVYSAVIYSRVKQFDMFQNHIRFLLAKWVPTPELEVQNRRLSFIFRHMRCSAMSRLTGHSIAGR